jgi:Flp pilus assembly protein TadD
MPQPHRFNVITRFAVCLLPILLIWGCASPPPASSPTTSPPVAGTPGEPTARPSPPATPPPGVPGGMRAREQPPSAAMVASAQWVEEASRAIDAGDYHLATELLERAISLEPNNGRAFYYYGLAMGERGRPGSALTLLQKAEILSQGDARALGDIYAQMGVNQERVGRRQEAIRRYEQALAQDPSHALARRRLEALKG